MSNTVSSHFQNSPSEFTANLSNKDTIMTSSSSNSSIPSSQQQHTASSHSIKIGHDSIEIDYESLPENSPIVAQLFAGAFAGIMEHTVMYPIDAIKTRMQASSSSNQFGKNKLPTGIIASVSRITSLEGTMALWRGVSSVITGAGPAHAIYYMVFESTKTTLCNNLISNRKINNNLVTDEKHPLIASISGIAATITSDALMTPFDVIKQRMQLNEELINSSKTKAATAAAASSSSATSSSAAAATTSASASATTTTSTTTTSSTAKALKSINNSSSNNTLLRTAFQIYKNEGMSTFFISYPTTLILSIPFAAINFGVYEYCSNLLNPNQSYNPLLHCVAGGISGAAAAAVTTPFDCIKTALQTKAISNEPLIKNANGFRDAASALYRIGGYSAFLKGLRPRVVFNVPSTAISWTAYEMAKAYLLTNEFSSSSNSKSSPPL